MNNLTIDPEELAGDYGKLSLTNTCVKIITELVSSVAFTDVATISVVAYLIAEVSAQVTLVNICKVRTNYVIYIHTRCRKAIVTVSSPLHLCAWLNNILSHEYILLHC